ncbi:unnamed protein product [Paramecium sonneborni]|uniref:Tetratricopeptide repeat protein n=1 Tax=Paramecium sonneborni TaxID=65129 RepID=A0A8S1REG5_9CILI|nr:unnamed protein product [Paramecium sonneborni]
MNIVCPVKNHRSIIERFCIFYNCDETKRVMCDECYSEQRHSNHRDQKKIIEVFEFIGEKSKECQDRIIQKLDQLFNQIEQSYQDIKNGLNQKYLLSKLQVQEYNGDQIHEVLCQMIKMEELYDPLNVIVKNFQTLIQNLQEFEDALNLPSLNYIQCSKESQQQSDKYFEKGYQLFNRDEFQQAIQILDESLKYNEKNILSLWCRSTCLSFLNDQNDAIKWIDKALYIDPNHVDSLYRKSECLSLLGKHEEALKTVEIALSIDSQNTDDYTEKLNVQVYQVNKRNHSKFQNYFYFNIQKIQIFCGEKLNVQACQENKKKLLNWQIRFWQQTLIILIHYLEECLLLQGQQIEALLWIEKGLKIDPEHINLLYIGAKCLNLLGRQREAIKMIDKLLQKTLLILMDQQQNRMMNIVCPVKNHRSIIERFCIFYNCDETKRVMCDECYSEQRHSNHRDQKKIIEVFEFIGEKSKECQDRIIQKLDQLFNQIEQSYQDIKNGLNQKYLLSKLQVQEYNGDQIHEVLCQMIKMEELYDPLNVIVKNFQTLIQNLQEFEDALNLPSLNYIQCSKESQQQSDKYFEKGYQLFNRDEFQQAIQILDESLKYNEKNILSLWCRSTCLSFLNDQNDAIKWIDKALYIDPNHVDSLYRKSECLSLLGKHEEALKTVEIALSIDSQNTDDYTEKLNVQVYQVNKRNHSKFQNYFYFNIQKIQIFCGEKLNVQACQENKKKLLNWQIRFWQQTLIILIHYLEECLLLQGQQIEALLWIEKGLKIDPEHINLLYIGAKCLNLLGRQREAIKMIDKLLQKTLLILMDQQQNVIAQLNKAISKKLQI